MEQAVDKYLDYLPFRASWRVKDEGAGQVVSTPLVGCRQQGSAVGFAYARLRKGESLSGVEGVDFSSEDAVSRQRLWTETESGSRIFQRTPQVGQASNGVGQQFSFRGGASTMR